MFFFSPKLTEYMQKKYHYTDGMIAFLRQGYFITSLSIVYDETLNYLKDKNQAELDELLQIADKNKPDYYENLEKFLVKVSDYYTKYPELQERIAKEVDKFREQMLDDFLNNLDEKTLEDVLKIGIEEMREVNTSEKHLNEVLSKKRKADEI